MEFEFGFGEVESWRSGGNIGSEHRFRHNEFVCSGSVGYSAVLLWRSPGKCKYMRASEDGSFAAI